MNLKEQIESSPAPCKFVTKELGLLKKFMAAACAGYENETRKKLLEILEALKIAYGRNDPV
jgi:hypothetical protein